VRQQDFQCMHWVQKLLKQNHSCTFQWSCKGMKAEGSEAGSSGQAP